MAQYHCRQCLWTIEQPVCPGCNQFLTDDIKVVESYMQEPEVPGVDMIDWCTAFGHWGDVMVCCGVMLKLLELKKQSKCNVLYVGPDLRIADWLRHQDFVSEVIAIKITNSEGTYSKFWQATARANTEPNDWLPFLKDQVEYLPKWYKYTQTHINQGWFQTRGGLTAQLWHDAKLPQTAQEWAKNILCERLEQRPTQVIHVHPISVWSESAKNHWPHWSAVIEWLIDNTPHTFVVTGQEEMVHLPTSPRLLNLIGATPTNLEVLALSDLCDGVISTPNNVAIWSVIQRQKALVVGNKATQFLTSYYARFLMCGEKMTLLNVATPFAKFIESAQQWFAE